ncbi:MAG: 3-dehydroquinate synthase [Tatlockia sp.]|nr:3-dehydroquinate synthase [Tatlockia sp.]
MAKFNLYEELNIRLPGHNYPILIGNGALGEEEVLRRYVASGQVLIVTNETVAPLYLNYLQLAFKDRQCDVVILQDGEAYKNQQSLDKIYDALILNQHHRDTCLIALGGGVIGDITGYAAATYQRGVSFIQIPTTVLAQVDASIGGKTAINYQHAKNMIGSFHQPNAVIIDLDTLKSLPSREFRAGLAEVIKYAFLEGGEFLNEVNNALKEGLADNECTKLPEIISQCCQIKTKFVQEDERETGLRALLNLGHTFAHALEAYTNYRRWLHGEAVAIGLYCATWLSRQQLGLDESSLRIVDEMLLRAKLPRRIPDDIDLNVLRGLMSQDKKIKNNRLRFVLMKAFGDCYLDDQVSEENLKISLQNSVKGV